MAEKKECTPKRMIFKALFGTCKHRISRASVGFAPCTPTRALPWTHWGAYSTPRPPAGFSNDLWSLHLVPTAQDCHTGAEEGHTGAALSSMAIRVGQLFSLFHNMGSSNFLQTFYPFIASPPPDINNDPSVILHYVMTVSLKQGMTKLQTQYRLFGSGFKVVDSLRNSLKTRFDTFRMFSNRKTIENLE